MPVPRSRPFKLNKDGTFTVNLPDGFRELLVSLADQIDEIVAMDVPETRRLFPTAYPNDAERDAGYQIFARDQLVNQRRTAADTVRETYRKQRLTEDEMSQWMAVVNDARLVLGTYLDVSEDDDELLLDDPDLDLRLIYHELGLLLERMVTTMSKGLPEPTDPDD
ncbi:MAG: DUF2017 domain-containing protein [Acidimicrobiia bacterium]|nr:DUF2017 domain-containing protein [Acidimicrobiia bacterium]